MIRQDEKTVEAVAGAAATNMKAGAWVAPAPVPAQITVDDDASREIHGASSGNSPPPTNSSWRGTFLQPAACPVISSGRF